VTKKEICGIQIRASEIRMAKLRGCEPRPHQAAEDIRAADWRPATDYPPLTPEDRQYLAGLMERSYEALRVERERR
jgi:hypothetical protein